MVAVEPVSLRFVRPAFADEVASPPHDALSAEQRRHHLARNPRSYLGVTRSAEDMNGGDSSEREAESVRASRAALHALLDEGVFGPPRPPSLYLYQLESSGHAQTGIVCGVETVDYDAGLVRVHERVNSRRAAMLAQHLRSVRAQSSPIVLAFRSAPRVEMLIERVLATSSPFLDVDDGQVHQRLWAIEDPNDISTAVAEMAEVPLYLIDGHHRAAAASADRSRHGDDHHLMLAVLFPARQLRNQAFHRVLRGVDSDDLIARLTARFPVREAAGADEVIGRSVDEFAVAVHPSPAQGAASDEPPPDDAGDPPRWLLVELPAGDRGAIDPVRLANEILEPVLEIDDSGADERLSYRPGPDDRAAVEAIRARRDEAVFLMRPVPIDTMLDSSDRAEVMPPKSTYFEPKVRSGLFVRLIERDITPA